MTRWHTRDRGLAIVILAALVAGSLSARTTVLAQSKPQEITTDDIFALVETGSITTATKTERPLKTAPLAATVITRQQLDAIGAVTISDALRLVPGMNTRWTPMGRFFGVRSFGSSAFASRVLILIDGVPYNSPDKGGLSGHPAYEDFFPIEHVKRIEVVKGPGSALYGQNAFEGIVNIITSDATDLAGTEVDVSGGKRDTAQIRLSRGGTSGDFAYSFTGKYKRQDGPMEFQRGSVLNNGDAYLKAAYKGLGVSYLFHRDTFDSFVFSPTQGKTLPTDQALNLLVLSHDTRLNDQWSSSLKVLYNRRDGNTCANCHDPNGGGLLINGAPPTPDMIQSEHEASQRFWVNEQMDWSPKGSLHRFVFGGEFQHDRSTKTILKRLDSEPNVASVGAFAQDEMTLVQKRVFATLGARVDRNQITGAAFSPSASLVYLPTEKLVVRGSVGRAFRQPTWNDLFVSQRFLPNAIGNPPSERRRVGNPELKPERITTVEGGAELFLGTNYSLKVDTFYSSIADYIVGDIDFTLQVGAANQPPRPAAIGPGPATRLAVLQNRADAIHTRGTEIEFRAKPNKFASGIVSYAYQTHDLDETTDSQASYVPKHKVTAMVTIDPTERLSITFDVNRQSRFNTASPGLTLGLTAAAGVLFGERVGEPFAIGNLNVNYLLVSNLKNKVGLSFQVRNLFDVRNQQTPQQAMDVSLRGRESFVKLYFKF